MGSIQFAAVPPMMVLQDPRPRAVASVRRLDPAERVSIQELSGTLEARIRDWMEIQNSSGAWRRHYSRIAHTWLEDVARSNRERIPPATGLYLRPGPEGLLCTGVETHHDDEWSFFGFLNLDDLERDLDIEPFLREYVRRLSILVPDLLWLYDMGPQAYWRGLPITVKGRTSMYPPRTAPRRDRIPRHVMEALGPAEPLPAEACRLCSRTDDGVTPQMVAGTVTPAHEQCMRIYGLGEAGRVPPRGSRSAPGHARPGTRRR